MSESAPSPDKTPRTRRNSPTRVLVVTTEPVPLPGFVPSGAGLRAWGLAQGLHGRQFQVEIAMAADSAQGPVPELHGGVAISIFQRDHLTERVRAARPDVLVMQHWGLMDRLGDVDCPLAIDLAGPHLLERTFWGTPSLEQDLEQKIAALRRADFLTCSGEFQRKYFIAFALQSGFDLADPHLLPVIPFSVAPELPTEREHDATTFAYCGMLLPWQDPRAGIVALVETLAARGKGRLRLIGARHPTHDVSMGKFDALLAQLATSPRVSLEPPRPFNDLEDLLVSCGVAIDLMARNAEREIAFTSRTVVYLACGLPVVHDNYSELSGLIEQYDAGWCLDPEDAQAAKALFARLLDDPAEAERRRENARRLVRERLTWDRTIEPLARWCADPRPREKKDLIGSGNDRIVDLRRRLAHVEGLHRELAGRRLVKLSNFLRRIGLHGK